MRCYLAVSWSCVGKTRVVRSAPTMRKEGPQHKARESHVVVGWLSLARVGVLFVREIFPTMPSLWRHVVGSHDDSRW